MFLGNTLLFAQQGIIKGKITDRSNEELAFANAQLKQNGNVIANAIADIEGNFIFKSLLPGIYEMKTGYVGYQSSEVSEIIVSADKTTFKNVEMEPSAIIICDIIICEYREPVNICCYKTCCITYCENYCSLTTAREVSDSSEVTDKEISEEEAGAVCKIYPNPFMERAVIEITSDMDFKWAAVQLFDLSGKKIREIDFSEKQVVIERENLTAGTYLYQVTSGSKSVATGSMVVQ